MQDQQLPIYIVNIMGADTLTTQGTRAPATMILEMLNPNNSVPAYGLITRPSRKCFYVVIIIFRLPARWASGFSGDHQQSYQRL